MEGWGLAAQLSMGLGEGSPGARPCGTGGVARGGRPRVRGGGRNRVASSSLRQTSLCSCNCERVGPPLAAPLPFFQPPPRVSASFLFMFLLFILITAALFAHAILFWIIFKTPPPQPGKPRVAGTRPPRSPDLDRCELRARPPVASDIGL